MQYLRFQILEDPVHRLSVDQESIATLHGNNFLTFSLFQHHLTLSRNHHRAHSKCIILRKFVDIDIVQNDLVKNVFHIINFKHCYTFTLTLEFRKKLRRPSTTKKFTKFFWSFKVSSFLIKADFIGYKV